MVICIVFFLLSTKSLGSVYLWNGIIKSWHWLPSLASWKWKWLSCVQLFATPCNVACQALLSMEISRQEHWSGLPFPSPEDVQDPGIELGSPALQAYSLPTEISGNEDDIYNAKKNTPIFIAQNVGILCNKNSAQWFLSGLLTILEESKERWEAL